MVSYVPPDFCHIEAKLMSCKTLAVRKRFGQPPDPLTSRRDFWGGTFREKHYLISRSPGQHMSQAGRGEHRAEVSREDRLPTR